MIDSHRLSKQTRMFLRRVADTDGQPYDEVKKLVYARCLDPSDVDDEVGRLRLCHRVKQVCARSRQALAHQGYVENVGDPPTGLRITDAGREALAASKSILLSLARTPEEKEIARQKVAAGRATIVRTEQMVDVVTVDGETKRYEYECWHVEEAE